MPRRVYIVTQCVQWRCAAPRISLRAFYVRERGDSRDAPCASWLSCVLRALAAVLAFMMVIACSSPMAFRYPSCSRAMHVLACYDQAWVRPIPRLDGADLAGSWVIAVCGTVAPRVGKEGTHHKIDGASNVASAPNIRHPHLAKPLVDVGLNFGVLRVCKIGWDDIQTSGVHRYMQLLRRMFTMQNLCAERIVVRIY